VSPAQRGRGHGSALIEQLAREEHAAVGVQLEVTNGNARALALYSRLGFRAGNRLLRRMRA
jgi:ribosomal protein S18 acetylase RimI-like enzyme